MVKFYTHVNRNVINSNRAHGTNHAPFSIRKGKNGKAIYAHKVKLPPGSMLIYSKDGRLLPCGARAVIESDEMPEVIEP